MRLLVFIAIFGANALAIRNSDPPTIERRQGFFPAVDTSGFYPSNSDTFYNDNNNNINTEQSLKFSNNLREDLYQASLQPQFTQQSSFQQQNPQQSYQQQQSFQQQQSPQQIFQQPQQKPPKTFQQNDIFLNAGEFSPLVQQQYNPNGVQQQYSPQSQQYFGSSQPLSQLGPSYPVSASIQFGNPQFNSPPSSSSLPPSSGPPPYKRRPTYSLYPPNAPVRPYGSNQPIYQGQQNFPIDPNGSFGDGGVGGNSITDSITNFLSNIGQGAASLLGTGGANTVGQGVNNFLGTSNNPTQYAGGPTGSFAGPLGSFRPPVNSYRPQFQGGNQFPSIRPQNAPNPPISQFAKAIEEITRNDDFQCIPKVLCQMVGSQRRQPSALSSPFVSALISAVPSTSAGLVYGRAALLGLTSGEHNCHTAYPKCPRNEDDLLYYLNNHRGGFFRFFNGGTAFGDDSQYQYKPNPYGQQQQQSYQQQYRPQSQPPPQQQQSSLASNLAAFQGLADAFNQGGGINLSNLGANSDLLESLAGLVTGGGGSQDSNSLASGSGILGNLADLIGNTRPQVPTTTPAPSVNAGGSISDLVGNLLTGLVGNRFSSRKISKRSVDGFTFIQS